MHHVGIDAVVAAQVVLLPCVDALGEVEVVVAFPDSLRLAAAVRVDIEVGDLVVAVLVDLMQPDERTDDRAVAARVLRRVSGAPGDSAVFDPVVVERRVPSVEHIAGQVFGLGQEFLVAGEPVGIQQLADEPHLVVVYVHDSRHVGCPHVAAAAVHGVDGPLPGLGVGGQREGAAVESGVEVEFVEQLRIAGVVLVVERCVAPVAEGFQTVDDGIHGLDAARVDPDASGSFACVGVGVVLLGEGHVVALEVVLHGGIGQLHGAQQVLLREVVRRHRVVVALVVVVAFELLLAAGRRQQQRAENGGNDFFHGVFLVCIPPPPAGPQVGAVRPTYG